MLCFPERHIKHLQEKKKSHCSWKKNETLEQTFIFKIRVVEDLLIKTLQKHRDLKDDSGEECYTFKILTTKRKESDVFERSFEYFYKEWVFCFIIRKRRNSLRSIAIVTMGGVADLCCCQRWGEMGKLRCSWQVDFNWRHLAIGNNTRYQISPAAISDGEGNSKCVLNIFSFLRIFCTIKQYGKNNEK